MGWGQCPRCRRILTTFFGSASNDFGKGGFLKFPSVVVASVRWKFVIGRKSSRTSTVGSYGTSRPFSVSPPCRFSRGRSKASAWHRSRRHASERKCWHRWISKSHSRPCFRWKSRTECFESHRQSQAGGSVLPSMPSHQRELTTRDKQLQMSRP